MITLAITQKIIELTTNHQIKTSILKRLNPEVRPLSDCLTDAKIKDMLQYFAGPIFTEWHWTPVLYFMFTWPYAAVVTLLVLIIAATNNSLASKNINRMPGKTTRKIPIAYMNLRLRGLGLHI